MAMLNSGEFGPIEEPGSNAKDEQNIKRRVYDALNVLISADVIQRVGKRVYAEHGLMTEKAQLHDRGENKDSFFSTEELARKQSSIQEKRDMVAKLRYKKELLETIFKRNRKKKYTSQ